jgi:hypothetical protein
MEAETSSRCLEEEEEPQQAKLKQIKQLEGELIWGDERRRNRRTEVRSLDLDGQKREREEVERMPHAAVAETARAHRNRAARSSAI